MIWVFIGSGCGGVLVGMFNGWLGSRLAKMKSME